MFNYRAIVPAAVAAGIGLAVLGVSGELPFEGVAALAQDGTGSAGTTPEKSRKGKRSKGTLVQIDPVRREPVVQTVPVIGRLIAVRAGTVAARIDAPVAEMRADVGDHVKAGEVLALLANDRLKWDRAQKAADLAATEAAAATAKARLALAEQELKRFQDLRNSAAFSRARYDDKRVEVARLRTEIAEAQAKVEKARATLRLAETELSYTRIVAPYDGTVTRRQTEMGSYVKEGQALFTMISDQDLEIEADVPAARLDGLRPGTRVAFELGKNARSYHADIRAIVPEEDPRTRTRMVRLVPRFEKRPRGIAANQSVTLHIPTGGGRPVLSVAKDALVSVRGQTGVFVVEDGRAHSRVVRIGEAVGRRFEVLDGLKEGDKVVVRGNERLRDGGRVRVGGKDKVVTE